MQRIQAYRVQGSPKWTSRHSQRRGTSFRRVLKETQLENQPYNMSVAVSLWICSAKQNGQSQLRENLLHEDDHVR